MQGGTVLLETLIAAVCAQNLSQVPNSTAACNTALQAYYVDSPRLQKELQRRERELRSYPFGNELITYVFIPAYTLASNQQIKINLYRNTGLFFNVQKKESYLEYSLPW